MLANSASIKHAKKLKKDVVVLRIDWLIDSMIKGTLKDTGDYIIDV